ncbi:MAG: class I SAM-dependent methyltransferase [Ardenticatenia bacterium]|nr:class I SAM-dependent methyltransferase [Ardenticatenia bacterium]
MAWEGRCRKRLWWWKNTAFDWRRTCAAGHKTGLYLDQRENRRRVGRLAAGRRCSTCTSYTGGFSVAAAPGARRGGQCRRPARPWRPRPALALNGLPPESLDYGFHAVDAMQFLEANRGPWDLIVADPPSMAPSAEARPKALVAYRRLSRLCLERLAPGGILVGCKLLQPHHRSGSARGSGRRRVAGRATAAPVRPARGGAGPPPGAAGVPGRRLPAGLVRVGHVGAR